MYIRPATGENIVVENIYSENPGGYVVDVVGGAYAYDSITNVTVRGVTVDIDTTGYDVVAVNVGGASTVTISDIKGYKLSDGPLTTGTRLKNFTISNVVQRNGKDYAVGINGCRNGTVTGLTDLDNSTYGVFYPNANTDSLDNVVVSDVTCLDGGQAIRFTTQNGHTISNFILTDFTIKNMTGEGILMISYASPTDSMDISISDGIIKDVGTSAMTIRGAAFGDTLTATVSISNVTATGSGTYALRASGDYEGSSSVLLRNCDFSGNTSGAIYNPSANITFSEQPRNVIGYITTNSGVTSVADGGSIGHGLAGTPTAYFFTATVASHIVAITGVSADSMAVSLTDTAGVAISVAEDVAWWAEIR